MPILKSNPPPVHPTPIHREARIAAERAIVALKQLYTADPFVFAALLDEVQSIRYDDEHGRAVGADNFLAITASKREILSQTRWRAHEAKLDAQREPVRDAEGVVQEVH